MPNLHTPERQADESQQQYKARRIASRRAVKRVLHGVDIAPHRYAASSERSERRAVVSAHGRRQALKAIKYWRAEDRYAKKLEADERASYEPVDA